MKTNNTMLNEIYDLERSVKGVRALGDLAAYLHVNPRELEQALLKLVRGQE